MSAKERLAAIVQILDAAEAWTAEHGQPTAEALAKLLFNVRKLAGGISS